MTIRDTFGIHPLLTPQARWSCKVGGLTVDWTCFLLPAATCFDIEARVATVETETMRPLFDFVSAILRAAVATVHSIERNCGPVSPVSVDDLIGALTFAEVEAACFAILQGPQPDFVDGGSASSPG